jgi:hypothetical protein
LAQLPEHSPWCVTTSTASCPPDISG